MKWRINPKEPIDYTKPHLFFAWKPVVIGDYKYWLCFLYRQAKFHYDVELKRQEFVIKHTKNYRWIYSEPIYYP